MICVEREITIQRPIEEVFAFVSDPSTTIQWQAEVLEYRQTSPGPMCVGATGINIRQETGQRVEATWEVTSFSPNEQFTVRSTSGALRYEITHTFLRTVTGTHLRARFQGVPMGLLGIPVGLLKIAEPLLQSSITQQFERDHGRLKEILERQ